MDNIEFKKIDNDNLEKVTGGGMRFKVCQDPEQPTVGRFCNGCEELECTSEYYMGKPDVFCRCCVGVPGYFYASNASDIRMSKEDFQK